MNKNVIWTVEGDIKEGRTQDLIGLMNEMLVLVNQEKGTLNYQWTLGEGNKLHIYERYQDEAAVFVHLGTWGNFAERFVSFVDITRFTMFTDVSATVQEAFAGLNPVYMKPIGGFAR